jgi:hypothetical protein
MRVAFAEFKRVTRISVLSIDLVAVWGMVTAPRPTELFFLVKPVLLRDDGPVFLMTSAVQEWTEIRLPGNGGGAINYRACPVRALTSAEAVEATVTRRLVEAFETS